MTDFEQRLSEARAHLERARDLPGMFALLEALEALAAERAEARSKPSYWHKSLAGLGSFGQPIFAVGIKHNDTWRLTVPGPWTAYGRAMTAPRMGGQHPHDGRHIMSISSWGMH